MPHSPGRPTSLLLALTLGALHVGAACAQERGGPLDVPVIGECDGCEAVFQGLPSDPGSRVRLAPTDEPGDPLRMEGTVYRPDGSPAPGVIVYAWHTDARGVYPPSPELEGAAARHGRLRGWAETDARGRYAFLTVRPGSYPDRDAPQHVHMVVLEPGCCAYWIDDVNFLDDPLLPPDAASPDDEPRGGEGLVEPRRQPDGGWVVTRDITLGQGVPGHPGG